MERISVQQHIYGTNNYVVGAGTLQVIHQLPEFDHEGYRDLGILRERVHSFWISGVLEKSIHREALLSLGRLADAKAVEQPWARTLELPTDATQLVPDSKKTSAVFYECGRTLLILGGPGSGKTMTLLDVVRDLIFNSSVDPNQPIPVVFNLSSWSVNKLSLQDWLSVELQTKYFVPKHLSTLWLSRSRLLLLLDGLDEVAPYARAECIAAIHEHIESFGTSGIIVCCRTSDYASLPVKLRFNAAIHIQPLTSEQVATFLSGANTGLDTVRNSIVGDTYLYELAKTPLMLNIIALTFAQVDASQSALQKAISAEAIKSDIFGRYIASMFRRRVTGNDPAQVALHDRLTALARHMLENKTSTFLIESLQPVWLSRKWERWLYFFLSRFFSGFFVVSCLWCAICMFLDSGLWILAATFFLAPYFGGLIGLIEATLIVNVSFTSTRRWSGILCRLLLYATCLIGPAFATLFIPRMNDNGAGPLLLILANTGLTVLFAVIFGFTFGGRGIKADVLPVETLKWSWKSCAKSLWRGTAIGGAASLPVGFVLGCLLGVDHEGQIMFESNLPEIVTFTFIVMLPLGLVAGLVIGGFLGGLERGVAKSNTRANEGIRLSFRNAILAATIAGPILGLVAAAIAGYYRIPRLFGGGSIAMADVPLCALRSGLFFGLLCSIFFGGFEVINHFTLRLLLAIRKRLPFNVSSFLDIATDLTFLRKVGGGYIFAHRLLLEHFAREDRREV